MNGRQSSGDSQAAVGANVAALAVQRWAVRCHDLQPVGGGDESLTWRVATDRGRLLLHLSPRRRDIEELRWVHAMTGRLADQIPARQRVFP